MFMQQSIDTGVPTAFRAGDGLESQSAVSDALAALAPTVPKGWDAALARAREAEFRLFQATSVGLTDDLARLEAHLAEITVRLQEASGAAALDLDLGRRNTMALIETTRTLMAAVPEAERIATRRAREERARRYQHRATPRNDEEVSAMLDLADAVLADAEAAKAEQREVQDLVQRASDAQQAARRLLSRELVSAIHDAARACKAVVGSKALRHASFPEFAPQEIGRTYQRAIYLRGLVQRLAAVEVPDCDAIFEAALGEDDWRTLSEVFKKQTGRWPTVRATRGA